MTPVSPASATVPGIWRRLACFVYEGVLLFGVVMIAGYLYGTLTQQRNALEGRHGLMAFLFVVLTIYFVWFWSHGGQTVAMRAWHLRLVNRDGTPLSQPKALLRALLAWAWFLPATLAAWLAGLHSVGEIFGVMTAGVLGYAVLARLHPRRQFLHDALCGTELVTWRPAPRKRPGTIAA